METKERTAPRNESGRPTTVDAVVLAGSINRIPLFPGNAPGRKALVPIAGRPLMAYVLDTLAQAHSVGRILVVGAPEVLEYATAWPRVEGLIEGNSLVDNAWKGLDAAGTERVLFCNPDQPLLRPEMVDHFVAHAHGEDADLVTSWARIDHLGPYTEGAHKFARFGDGEFAHGNLFLARRHFPHASQVRHRLDAIYAARKNAYKFAWSLGPKLFGRFMLALALRRLPTLRMTLEMTGQHFGITLGCVESPYPEIVLDIDEPEDYTAALRYLSWSAAPQPVAAAL